MIRRTAVLSLAILSMAGLGACRHKVVAAPTPVATSDASNADSLAALRARQRADSIAAAERAAREAAAVVRPALRRRAGRRARRRRSTSTTTATTCATTHAPPRCEGRRSSMANPSVTVAITGHTDERGTAEYNLALGQRRAAQVKRYLTSKGIDDARLTTQSMGDSQPAVQGTDESAYQQNRRAEFQPSGAGNLVAPRS